MTRRMERKALKSFAIFFVLLALYGVWRVVFG